MRVLKSRSLCLGALVGLLSAIGAHTGASAQELEPYDITPAPAGTNLAIFYYVYAHNTEFNIAGGNTVKNSGLELNVGIARYVHYIDLGGYAAGFQIYDAFGSLSDAHIGSERLGSAFGSQNVTLGAFIWPYVNAASKTYVNLAGFINPPSGTYDKNQSLTVGDNRWRGDAELVVSRALTDRLSVDVGFDTQFYGDNNGYTSSNLRLSQAPTYRAQVWANWRWNPSFTTSIGYEGFFGGSQEVDGVLDGSKTEEQRIRANAAVFVTARLQTMLELNHDVAVVGGFKQDFGATLRLLYVF